jgi:CheY-like chemotaxis protein
MYFLAIDDDFRNLMNLTLLFRELGTYDAATYGRQGLSMYQDSVKKGKYYSLIIIDADLHDVNSFDLLKKIQFFEEKINIPKAKKMLVSSSSNPKYVTLARQHNCDAFLIKPLKRESFNNKLRELGIIKIQTKAKIRPKTINDLIKEREPKEDFVSNMSDAQKKSHQRYLLRKEIRSRKKHLFKNCEKDPKMMAVLDAVIGNELWRMLDE